MGKTLYNFTDGILEIIVRDEFGAKTDNFKMNLCDKRQQSKIALILLEKYNVDLTPEKSTDLFDF